MKKKKNNNRKLPGKEKRPRIRLGRRDMKILQLVGDLGMATQEALHACLYTGQGRDAVKSTLRRLCGPKRGKDNAVNNHPRYLQPECLDGNRVYYRLTEYAANLLGVSKNRARPLGVQARVRRYAMLWLLCIDQSGKRLPLNPRDFPDAFDVEKDRLSRAHFYVEETPDGQTRLGYAIVDSGRQRIRVFRGAAAAMRRLIERGWINEFMAAGCFDLAVLTSTDTARRGIELGLADYLRKVLDAELSRFKTKPGEKLPFRLRVFVVPGLIDVIPGAAIEKG